MITQLHTLGLSTTKHMSSFSRSLITLQFKMKKGSPTCCKCKEQPINHCPKIKRKSTLLPIRLLPLTITNYSLRGSL